MIETANVEFSPIMLDKIVQGKSRAPEDGKGVINKAILSIPYIRLINKKIKEASIVEVNIVTDANNPTSDDMNIYIDKMNAILCDLSKKSIENDIELVILFHQQFWEDADRNIITQNSPEYINAFKICCENNNIKLIDVTNKMIESYRKDFKCSYGFPNTAPGEGHLNKTGHRIIAEELYKSINEMEENK